MRAPNTVHKWLLSLILLIGCLSVSAKEKEYILFLSSVNAEEAWITVSGTNFKNASLMKEISNYMNTSCSPGAYQ